MALPTPGMVIERPRTALVITDLQNDFLSPGGAAGGLVKDSLAANNTIENIEALLRAARDGAYPVFLSPHYYCSQDTVKEAGRSSSIRRTRKVWRT
jgi:nicotinamidase-related amidase